MSAYHPPIHYARTPPPKAPRLESVALPPASPVGSPVPKSYSTFAAPPPLPQRQSGPSSTREFLQKWNGQHPEVRPHYLSQKSAPSHRSIEPSKSILKTSSKYQKRSFKGPQGEENPASANPQPWIQDLEVVKVYPSINPGYDPNSARGAGLANSFREPLKDESISLDPILLEPSDRQRRRTTLRSGWHMANNPYPSAAYPSALPFHLVDLAKPFDRHPNPIPYINRPVSSHCAIHRMHIVMSRYPSWRCEVRRPENDPVGIRCKDVFIAIWKMLQEPLNEEELDRFSLRYFDDSQETANRRAAKEQRLLFRPAPRSALRPNPDHEPYARVDVLDLRVWFGGLKKDGAVWVLDNKLPDPEMMPFYPLRRPNEHYVSN